MIARIVSRGDEDALDSVMIGPWERSLAGPNRTGIVFAARDDGEGDAGRLPPVVSSLFSIKAAHWRDGIRGTELGARGKERTARQRRVIGYRMCRRHACLYRHPAIIDRQNSNKKGN